MATTALTTPISAELDRPARWARDLAVVGGVTGVTAPLAAMTWIHILGEPIALPYLAVAGVTGAVTGATLGAITPALLRAKLARLPRAVFAIAGIVVGALWGGVVGSIAGEAISPGGAHHIGLCEISAMLAAPVGALQLGWFWVTATSRRVRRRPMGKLFLAAAAVAPALGLLAAKVIFAH